MAFLGGQYALTASAVNLTTALGLTKGDLPSGGYHVRQIDIKNANGAANFVYVGASNVTNAPANARVELVPGQAWSEIAPGLSSFNTDEIYVVGTVNAANIIFVTLVA